MKRAIDSHLELYHYYCESQYSSQNAWNVNFNNANVNNNTKSNSNVARDYHCNIDIETLLEDILLAYYVCRKNKRTSYSGVMFESKAIPQLVKLAYDLKNGTYSISESICFIVERPTKREVFAAQFIDRVVHHYIALRLEPIFERILPDVSMANRKRKGTKGAIDLLSEYVNKGKEKWIYKFDLKGYFMSIDKRLLWNKVDGIINTYYNKYDKDLLLHLVYLTIMHSPQLNCVRVCDISKWDGLDKNKSLFSQDAYHGLPIGNLPSQMFANIYMMDFIAYLRSLGLTNVVHYVDDLTIVADKKDILNAIPLIRAWLKENLGLTLHPRKCYIQHTSKGVAFLGAIVKPHRTYIGKRTMKNAMKAKTKESVNSYLGLMIHHFSYKIRQKIKELHPKMKFSKNLNKV